MDFIPLIFSEGTGYKDNSSRHAMLHFPIEARHFNIPLQSCKLCALFSFPVLEQRHTKINAAQQQQCSCAITENLLVLGF